MKYLSIALVAAVMIASPTASFILTDNMPLTILTGVMGAVVGFIALALISTDDTPVDRARDGDRALSGDDTQNVRIGRD